MLAVIVVSGCTTSHFSPAGIESGIYVFKAVVCDSGECIDENSEGFYESTLFILEIGDEVCQTGCSGEGLNHVVTNYQKQDVKDNIKISESRVVALSPYSGAWKKGEKGMYSVAIENNMYDNKDFSVNICLDNLGGALEGRSLEEYSSKVNSWLTYNTTIFVGSGNIEFVDVEVRPSGGLLI